MLQSSKFLLSGIALKEESKKDRKDRNRLGGGVAIYARDALNVKNMSQLVPISIEAVCVEVTKPKMKPFLITSIYLSHVD